MASIESLGLGSGVLTTDLVEQIISAEREVTELRLDSRQELIEAKITAYGEIQSLMSTMQTAVNRLASPSTSGATVATVRRSLNLIIQWMPYKPLGRNIPQ